jgi:SAM-dependent methyltransferase
MRTSAMSIRRPTPTPDLLGLVRLAAVLRTWPLPALAAWSAAWCVHIVVLWREWPPLYGLAGGIAVTALCAWFVNSRWRRLMLLAGFPLSVLLLARPEIPAWTWGVALLPLWVLYPKRAWQDAPLYPTPQHALEGLAWGWPGEAPRRILDAGCGLGHGLAALHAQWPKAELHGIEWSAAWAWLAKKRSPFATVVRGDMWAADWSGYDLVYVFQRPESMERILAKAESEMKPGSWLVSLEFEMPSELGRRPDYRVHNMPGKPVLAWRMRAGARGADGAAASTAAVPGR